MTAFQLTPASPASVLTTAAASKIASGVLSRLQAPDADPVLRASELAVLQARESLLSLPCLFVIQPPQDFTRVRQVVP
ncbi:hypothetical protein KIF59_13035 [Enterobacter cloacae subsp. cloacae]|nr:hypothetical protein [Enterobacter cloacae subsp. cloacae]